MPAWHIWSDAMKRFRLSTLMLLIAIAALCIGLVVQHHRAARREADLQARLALSWPLFLKERHVNQRILGILVSLQQRLRERLDKETIPGQEAREAVFELEEREQWLRKRLAKRGDSTASWQPK